MSDNLHDFALPPLTQRLNALLTMLDKAQADAESRKYDTAVLANARLAPDMLPFFRQIHIATDFAKGCATRLANVPVPKYEDTETTFDELRARIRKTLDQIAAVTREQTADAHIRRYQLKLGPNEFNLSGLEYVRDVVFPHFYFHVTTAYAILRHNGVALGKMDFVG
jgi:uncharacterized protein